MQTFSLFDAQDKRSKALSYVDMREYWLWDAMICLHLGRYDWAMESLTRAMQDKAE